MATLVATKNPGEYLIPELNKVIKLVEWREDDLFDSVILTDGAVPAGTSLEFFRDLTGKNLQDTNLRTARRIPSGSEFVLQRVGVLFAQALGNVLANVSDIIKVGFGATLTFKVNDRLVTEGPLFKYQTGYGFTGSPGFDPAAATPSLITTGVPSVAAAPVLLVQQTLNDVADLQGTIDFRNNTWIASFFGGAAGAPTPAMATTTLDMKLMLMMHGLVKRASNQ